MCPVPAIESQIEQLAAMLEEAIERGDVAHAEELNYELNELCNQAEEDCGI